MRVAESKAAGERSNFISRSALPRSSLLGFFRFRRSGGLLLGNGPIRILGEWIDRIRLGGGQRDPQKDSSRPNDKPREMEEWSFHKVMF